MKIGCLQFAPHVGDVHNNLNRADAVLNKGSNLEELDLLVLPELAFTGYNFRSLAEISPCLEPTGSGISALWARTIALKYGCNVVVGYPEKVDVAHKWPASPEYYNSALIISKDGDTIANYRKSHLYTVDEKWALEGQDGFFEGEIEGMGNVAMGICMDINPYKFEAPWHAFEFAFHVLEVEANLVIITMAWLTTEDPSTFSRLPLEPDLGTLEYWVQRLEPIIRTGHNEEIIVVFCNRCGTEGDAVYAGTSAVIGILNGEISLYGVLGRGVKDVLIVDTDRKPFAKLARVSDDDGQVATDNSSKTPELHSAADASLGRKQFSSTNPVSSAPPAPRSSPNNGQHNGTRRTSSRENSSKRHNSREPPTSYKDDTRYSSKTTTPQTAPGPQPLTMAALSKISLPQLTLQIPDSMISPLPPNWKSPAETAQSGTPLSGISGVTDIPTPTAPSPTPLSMRPKFPFPEPSTRAPQTTSFRPPEINTNVSRVKRVDTPITPPRMANSKTRQPTQESTVEKPPSPPSDDAMIFSQPVAAERRTIYEPINSTPRQKAHGVARETPPKQAKPDQQPAAYYHARPPSTKSRNTSNTRRASSVDFLDNDLGRERSRSRMAIPLMASPDLFDQDAPGQQIQHTETPIFFQPESYPVGWTPQPEYQQRVSDTPYDRRSDSRYGNVAAAANAKTEDYPSRQPSRPVSRGRQPFVKRTATNGMGNQQWSNVAANWPMEKQEQPLSKHRSVHSVDRPGPSAGPSKSRRQSASGPSRSTSANWLSGTASPMRTYPPLDPDDEIVAVINLVGNSCPLHNVGGSQSGSVPPQVGQQRHQEQRQQQQTPEHPQQNRQARYQQQQQQQTPQQPQQNQQARHQQQHHHHHHHQQHQQAKPQPQRQLSQQRVTATTTQPRHQSASGAPRQQTAKAQSASVPPAAAQAQDGVYELILPPHIRQLVDAMTSPEARDPFAARGLERRVGTSTPKTFNPPTPTAMQFSSQDDRTAA